MGQVNHLAVDIDIVAVLAHGGAVIPAYLGSELQAGWRQMVGVGTIQWQARLKPQGPAELVLKGDLVALKAGSIDIGNIVGDGPLAQGGRVQGLLQDVHGRRQEHPILTLFPEKSMLFSNSYHFITFVVILVSDKRPNCPGTKVPCLKIKALFRA
ncbi:N-acetylglucosamine-1-phosphate uridyltransferase [Moorella thermoacetica Y72]|uniref:N-acetylglucosamine-1-phosphate uridyltransferase n=1 Tax=Moorella thermoacetica Y72 TaxID=1325331 RepID=A0A0S6UFW1_NEOTH|nr:N-acetylglucosamine-1-phosphate uridyltransferase [Moorella thermoacetica Y72]